MSKTNGWFFVFFFNATATTEIYTLSLHEELPIPPVASPVDVSALGSAPTREPNLAGGESGRSGPHQHWSLYTPATSDHYLVESRVTRWSWHRELPMDECWCYDGVFPGTRIHARRGRA